MSPHLPLQVQFRPGTCRAGSPIPGEVEARGRGQIVGAYMKINLRSRNSNLKRTATTALVGVVLLCVSLASTIQIFAQRAGRPPQRRQLEGTPILPAGTAAIPDGTVLVIEMDSKINSGTAQVSDQFYARIAKPVIDAGGRTLLQSGTMVVGHVTSVKKAKWGHRSGELGLQFDWIELGDRRIPIRGTLVSGSNPIDGEGDLRAKSAAKRDVLVTTGGAVAGAGVGMVTGTSLLLGGGAGAAAGLTLVLAMKGKNVDIDPGEQFNLQLVQPMSLTGQRIGYGSSRITTPVPLQSRGSGGTGTIRPSLIPGQGPPGDLRTQWSRVLVSDVQASRGSDGLLQVRVRAETPTEGWRIYTNHQIQTRDTLDIRIMGIPPSQYGVKRVSRPEAAPICIEDRNSEIRRIIVRGTNERHLTIGTGTISAQPDRPYSSNQPPYQSTDRPRPGPADGSTTGVPYGGPISSSTQISQLAREAANQVQILRFNYGAQFGQEINNSDGTNRPLSGRRLTPTEQQMYDSLRSLENSARSLPGSFNRQRAGQQLRIDTQNASQLWESVRSSSGIITSELSLQWQNARNSLLALSDTASR
jgi:hypothetical protein